MLRIRKTTIWKQLLISLAVVLASTLFSYGLLGLMDYHAIALILLVTVSILAMILDIVPVIVAATSSALIWNFVFIPPRGTFFIGSAEDVLMFLMYFVIAMVHAALTYKIRQIKKRERDREEHYKIIKLYNTLFNSLSHELLTPISTIIGSIDTILENRQRLSRDQENELLTEIGSAGLRLNRQVDNLLSMSRLESGVLKPKMDWCDLNELIHGVINDLTKDFEQHRITFDPNEQLPLIKADTGLLQQIVKNILHNSLVHTPANTLVIVEVRYNSTGFEICISDNGFGFPEQEIPFVFDKFYRLSSSAGGTGLGLSIAKGFTEAHNGKINLENNRRGGAKFTIYLPSETAGIIESYGE